MAETGTGYYDDEYGHATEELYAAIRREAFGEEIGQFSWLTADEYRLFLSWLRVEASSHLLEVASGNGGPTLFGAQETGCRVTGVDIHAAGVDAANARAFDVGLADRAEFVCADARAPLPFEDGTFDALICIDAWNHIFERETVLRDWQRVLRPGGRMLVTDPIVVTGMLRREELETRSGRMGEFVFTAPGVDEALVRAAGFVDVRVEDTTENMWEVPFRWRAARERHAAELVEAEGADEHAAFQHFLDVVGTLARERRLTRIAVIATRP
jgi:SAM-dependent methyltransferase